ncbi:conserved hypothetical protein [Culex quinquefasciatus]|uniref:Ionotropic glutamate receptor L-glutamate and glycine-binding domain-containing protein n=1 Tax=Culex quinquefasciatus TaxID=7176 RepID=B0WIG3_CULQU|nr:conserved hypothetical protein [Culex quinquefasciatus]|eukprot:XP_001848497.1 conserved hypothetical protein [Culex quinquefasciatus]
MPVAFVKFVTLLAIVPNVVFCNKTEHFLNFWKITGRESESEICVVNTALNDHGWSDFIVLVLGKTAKPYLVQRLIASNDSEFALRVCSVIVSPIPEDDSEQVIEGLFSNKALNRFAWIVLVSTGDSSKYATVHRYRDFVRRYNILNSVLVIYGNFYRHDLLIDETVQVSEVDFKHTLQFNGWPFRVEDTKARNLSRRKKRILSGVYYVLLKEFSTFTNATVQWILSDRPAPKLKWFLDNRIDIHLHVPLIFHTRFEIMPEYQLQGVCLLVPEKVIGPYVHHLLKPFQTSLWLLILVVIVTLITLKIGFKRWFQEPLCLQILFGVSKKSFEASGIERALLLVLFWLMFILCECYSNRMISFMMNTRYQPHFQSFEEFNKINATTVIQDGVNVRKHHFHTINSHRLEYRKRINKLSINESYLTLCDWAQTFISSEQNMCPVEKRTLFYMLPDRVSTFLRSSMFLPTSIFTVRLRMIYYKIIEAGIWDHWMQQERKELKLPEQLQHLDLTFDDLISIWWILAWGAALGGSVLLLEVGIFQRRRILAWMIALKQRMLMVEVLVVSVKNFLLNYFQRICF